MGGRAVIAAELVWLSVALTTLGVRRADAAVSGVGNPRPAGAAAASQCPLPDAVWSALQPVVAREVQPGRRDADLADASDGPAIEVVDLGGAFRVRV